MSNLIRHPKFVLDDDDSTLAQLEAGAENLRRTIGWVRQSGSLFSASSRIELCSTLAGVMSEIEEMQREASFSRERLNALALRLVESRRVIQRKLLVQAGLPATRPTD